MTYRYINRNNRAVFFTELPGNKMILTNYTSLGITGDPLHPVAVDPDGGPYLAIDAEITLQKGEGTFIIRSFEITPQGVILIL